MTGQFGTMLRIFWTILWWYVALSGLWLIARVLA